MSEIADVRSADVTSDPDLSKTEKETTLTCPNDVEWVRIYTEIPAHIRWVLSVEESEIEEHRTDEGSVVAVKAKVPKGIIKFQSSPRKSNTNGEMASRKTGGGQ